jgi:DNA replication protein
MAATKNDERPFKGFPDGKNGTIQVPNTFFSDLLPLIDNLAELKLTIHCFWALQQREGKYRYVRLRDLLNDGMFLSSLDQDTQAAVKILRAALDAAEDRGTLLHITIPGPVDDEHLYFMNTEKGRAAIEALERGDWVPGTHDNPVALIAERPNIFALYEQNIGPLTPMISDILRDAENTYPAEWIEEGLKIAVETNKRSWRYVEAILKRWTTEGKSSRAQAVDPIEQNPYLQDEYFRRRDTD